MPFHSMPLLSIPADRRQSARRRVGLCTPCAAGRQWLRLRYSSLTLATRYYTSFVEKRKLYIVMELVDGVTLGSFLSDHANHSNGADSPAIGLPEKLIWQIFLQVRLPL